MMHLRSFEPNYNENLFEKKKTNSNNLLLIPSDDITQFSRKIKISSIVC